MNRTAKRILFAAAAVVSVFAVLEIALRVAGFQGAPALSKQLDDIRFSVAGELFGEFDPYRFWRLPNVEPRFSGDNPRIVCMADSVTVMYEGRGYPDLLADSLKQAGYAKTVEVFNAGVPEYTTHQGMVYLTRELIREKPDLVTIQYGWNDHWPARLGVPDHRVSFPDPVQRNRLETLLQWRTYRLLRTAILAARFLPRVPLDRYKENLENMVRAVRMEKGKAVLIVPVLLDRDQEWAPLHRKYMDATRRAAAAMGAPCIDLQPQFARDPTLFIEPDADPTHFNWKGAKLFADAIADVAVQKGLLP